MHKKERENRKRQPKAHLHLEEVKCLYQERLAKFRGEHSNTRAFYFQG